MKIIISSSSKEPIYQQITKQIIQGIMNGELEEGDSLPSIRQLAKDLEVSVITTKRAYEDLEKEGYIVSQVGKGSFIAGQNETLIREKRLKVMEAKLQESVLEGKALKVSLEELTEMVKLFYEEEE